jgi:hypothetical protein
MPNNKSSGIFHYAAILRVLMNSTVIKLRNSDNNKTGLGEIIHLPSDFGRHSRLRPTKSASSQKIAYCSADTDL